MVSELMEGSSTAELPDRRSVPAQAAWRFFHDGVGPIAQATPYSIRQFVKAALPSWPHLQVSVRQSQASITFTSRDRLATRWLIDHMAEVLGVVSDFAGQMLQVDPKMLVPGFIGGTRYAYAVPKVIVQRADKKDKWARWLSNQLEQSEKDELQGLITAGVAAELKRWEVIGESFSPGGIVIVDYGRAMPIVPADGPRGLARLGVRFIAPWQIHGEVFVGLHSLLGYGLVHRRGELGSASSVRIADEESI